MLDLLKNQANDIPFVLVDNMGVEVPGLGGAFNVWVRKAGGAFAVSTGAKAELGNGWYRYIATALECNTDGSLALRVTGVGVVQQNLVYTVAEPTSAYALAAFLLQSVPTLAECIRTSDLAMYRGDTWTQVLTGLGDLTGAADIWFGIKTDPDDHDDNAVILISSSLGLERINGQVALVPGNGSITVVNVVQGIIRVDLAAVETAKLAPDRPFWDCQVDRGGIIATRLAGRIAIRADIVRTTS